VKKELDAADRALERIEFVFVASFTIAALCLGVTQVILRYAFNSGVSWSEAIFVLLTNVGMLFAGSLAVKHDKHVRVDLLLMILPKHGRRALLLVSHLVSLALCAIFFIGGILYVRFVYTIDSVSPEKDISDWIIYMIVPITMGLFTLRYFIRVLRTFRGEEDAKPHGLPHTAPELEGRP
jgi:C4-dicarboxylate transporter DctQ subunit